jgi:hypothetical protein
MTAASRSLATALCRARFASGLLRRGYTTKRDTTSHTRMIATHPAGSCNLESRLNDQG